MKINIVENKISTAKAVKWTGYNLDEVYNITNGSSSKYGDDSIIIKDVRGNQIAFKGDWIILDVWFRVLSEYQFNKIYKVL